MKAKEYNEKFIKGFQCLRREMMKVSTATTENGDKKAVE